MSYLLTGTEESYVHIRIKVTEFIRSNGTHIQNAQAYLEQSKMGQNSVWATEKEILAAARLMHKDIVMYSFNETYYGSARRW